VQLPDPLAGRLERLVATAQAEQRSPSVVAAVVRGGRTIWQTSLGVADVEG
jgi:CubicO group peptidase (beta-lactamase class C family)